MKRILNKESRAAIELMIANDLITKDIAEKYFPELKESEDERIRKALIKHFRWNTKQILNEFSNKKALAWLEKQGERKSLDNMAKEVIKDKDAAISFLKSAGIMNEKGELAEQYRQVEQKPDDKVEPKFKIGDIVKHKDNPHLTYILKRFTDDGDYEFHAIGKDGHEGCTCFTVVKYQDDWELVEQKPKKCMYSNNNYTDEERKILCDGCKEECELRQKPSWSEEDEVKINRIVACLENLNVADNDILLKDVEWLKSLRPQSQWKPTELQLECLSDAIDSYNKRGYSASVLSELLEQLKKLREE